LTQTKTEKCFGYVRVSGDSQLDGDGFPRQESAIRTYAARNGLKVAKIFREEAVTGTRETMDRQAWAAMMTALHSNGVKTILIERLDRLSRSLLVQEATIAELQKQGFRLVSAHEPELMSDDPTRIAFRQMIGVFSQYDKSQIVLKLRAARLRKRAADGRCEGRKPYGSRNGEHRIVDRMQQMRAEGAGYHTIADRLNEEAIRPRSGKQWYPMTVSKILARTAKP
jgi:DNA invertase Pin-like site-specific DNA recombinase